MLYDSFFAAGRYGDWQLRVLGGAGGVLTAAAATLLLLRGHLSFWSAATLFGVFFIALACLSFGTIPQHK